MAYRFPPDIAGRTVADPVDRVEARAHGGLLAEIAVAETQVRAAFVVDFRNEVAIVAVAAEQVVPGVPLRTGGGVRAADEFPQRYARLGLARVLRDQAQCRRRRQLRRQVLAEREGPVGQVGRERLRNGRALDHAALAGAFAHDFGPLDRPQRLADRAAVIDQ